MSEGWIRVIFFLLGSFVMLFLQLLIRLAHAKPISASDVADAVLNTEIKKAAEIEQLKEATIAESKERLDAMTDDAVTTEFNKRFPGKGKG